MTKKTERRFRQWQKRDTLAITGFFGLALMYSLRFNLSIGIVAMVDHSQSDLHVKGTETSLHTNHSATSEICPALISLSSANESSQDLDINGRNVPTFKWNEQEQGLILGAFFWGYIITQFPGGILAQRFGGKWVISVGLLSTGILSFILPWAAMSGGKNFVLVIRILQGISEGVMFPAFTVLLAKWTAPKERAGLATLCFSGMPFGTGITMIMSGHLISTFGWPAVFYAPGILTIVWFICWSLLVYSSPREHPTISDTERKYIEDAIKEEGSTSEEHLGIFDIPWKAILCSVPFWAIFMSHFANTWGHNTLKTQGPKYLHSVLHFNIHENAYIAATPYFAQLIFCNIVTRVSDYLMSKNLLSLAASRRLCNTIGQGGTALAYLCLIMADCNRSLAILFYMMSGLFNGAVYGGMLINPIDISPNYAGAIEGLINGLSNIAGFCAPYVAGLILHNEHSISGWHYVFLIPVVGDFVGNLCFVLFCSTKVQPWNNKNSSTKDVENSEN
ncbi:unnamed protein product [Orchesella dallaii]|uniref:Major facilitator superfamily (MFS) profile domain-containing protein n=1 Tax=Orchesella dallaii TaxID=48710 RepID=A0ABP1PR87_9HEXA